MEYLLSDPEKHKNSLNAALGPGHDIEKVKATVAHIKDDNTVVKIHSRLDLHDGLARTKLVEGPQGGPWLGERIQFGKQYFLPSMNPAAQAKTFGHEVIHYTTGGSDHLVKDKASETYEPYQDHLHADLKNQPGYETADKQLIPNAGCT